VPAVLLAKVGWMQGAEVGNEEGKVVGSGLLRYAA
jgi:hypothetical protein